MITDTTLRAVAVAPDQAVVIEIYASSQAPTTNGFDPANALKRYATVAGIVFAGVAYTRLIRSMGKSRRTTTEETNTFDFELDNFKAEGGIREAAQFEFTTGFEGCIVVQRLISLTLSTGITSSIILFAGRCDKPLTGTRESLPITAKQIISNVDVEIPRRKFTATDAEGRSPTDPLFEGFPYMPQTNAGSTTLPARVAKGGLWGLLGMKKTVMQTLQFSSFSDMDAEKCVPVILGRAQIAGTHLAYTDEPSTQGGFFTMTTAFCEGDIESYGAYHLDDARYFIGQWRPRSGQLGGSTARAGFFDQTPNPTPTFIATGYYSKTAFVESRAGWNNVDTVDPAPLIIAPILGTRITVPNSSGVWSVPDTWSDNAAAHAYYLFTSSDYYNLDANWLDLATFTECFNFNDGIIFDKSNSDILFIPDTASFTGGDSEKGRFLLSTGSANPTWFKYRKGTKTAAETFLLTPHTVPYDTDIPIDPPDDPPDTPGHTISTLGFYLRRRYTSNVVVSEQMSLIDFLHEVLFMSSRMFMTQGPNGKLKLKNKKPVDWALSTAVPSGTSAAVDDITPWITDLRGFGLFDPNTAMSEVRTVSVAAYSSTQNSATLSASANIGVSGFAGCDSSHTPATATLTVNSVTAAVDTTITLDGTAFTFTPGTDDDVYTAAGFICGTINAHPILNRKFIATWDTATAAVVIKGKFGTLTVSSAFEMIHTAPLANPATGPTLTPGGSGGTLPAGAYLVGYTYVNSRGQTLMSPITSATVTLGQKITVSAVSLPSGATSINWFTVPVVASNKLRLRLNNNGASFVIDKPDLPVLTAALPPDVNRTGCEVIRVEAVFSDRAATRSAITASNVLKASFKWKLGNRADAKNVVELKFRDSTQDFRLVSLELRDDAHIAKIHKKNPEKINGQAIDNYHQAYRIASGRLAELVDADFFHEWESDRLAVLLEEGDVVAITDDGAETYNLPVRIEAIEFEVEKGFTRTAMTGRKYSTTLYDDSVVERMIPVIVEPAQGANFV